MAQIHQVGSSASFQQSKNHLTQRKEQHVLKILSRYKQSSTRIRTQKSATGVLEVLNLISWGGKMREYDGRTGIPITKHPWSKKLPGSGTKSLLFRMPLVGTRVSNRRLRAKKLWKSAKKYGSRKLIESLGKPLPQSFQSLKDLKILSNCSLVINSLTNLM